MSSTLFNPLDPATPLPPHTNPLDPTSPFHPLNAPRPFALPTKPSVPLASLVPAPVSWLWFLRIPKGKVTLLAGDPGTGKSFLALDLAARISAGLPLPDSPNPNPPASVLLLSAEDDPLDSLHPRLTSLNADLHNIHLIDPQPVLYQRQVTNPPVTACSSQTTVRTNKRWTDRGFAEMGWPGYEYALDDSAERRRIDRITRARDQRQAMAPTLRRPFCLTSPESLALLHAVIGDRIKHGPPPALLIVDPVTAFVSADASSGRAARLALANLADIARAANIAVLAITHLTKNPRAKTIHRTSGALNWVTASRVAWLLERDHTPHATLSLIKSNIPIATNPLRFQLLNTDPSAPATLNNTPRPTTQWEIPRPSLTPTELDAAKALLLSLLAQGPLPMTELHSAARGHAIALITLRRAKKALDIQSSRDPASPRWLWSLPSTPSENTSPAPEPHHTPT